ncbi:serine/threonine-protein phosphatase [Flavobacterium galactosidilyticum]|uniref:PP2C family protein-serine/threonine phosphatase n=1 Tax=Flavobacterium galactosidilyticum TaxID=2893886 RepID=UPI001E54AE0F|nr:PP2C family serine/threonine-protein phosphatase [Flavobacterium sp. F-340]UFH45341.1 serine/threonine-protein phosphatase [Flavobacterium sp. F-340]
MNIISHTGIGKRKENQDIILIEELSSDTQIYLIADGMGGYENGKKAADLVAGTVFNYLRNCNQVNSTSIDEAIKKANLSIKGLIDQYDTKSGATLGCLILGQEKSFLFWVGDVSLYLFKDDNQIFKSKSHSLINEMLDMGNIISSENIEKYKHIVTKSISGKREIIEKGYFEIMNYDYSSFVICSDGVTDTISILDFVRLDFEKINNELIEKSKDNYSYIIGINNDL